MRQLWGDYISMIPQNPMTSLNPIRRIGSQIEEAVTAHAKLSEAQRRDRAIELMTRVGIPPQPRGGCGTIRTTSPAACCNAP